MIINSSDDDDDDDDDDIDVAGDDGDGENSMPVNVDRASAPNTNTPLVLSPFESLIRLAAFMQDFKLVFNANWKPSRCCRPVESPRHDRAVVPHGPRTDSTVEQHAVLLEVDVAHVARALGILRRDRHRDPAVAARRAECLESVRSRPSCVAAANFSLVFLAPAA